eukprot:13453386-Heterocapsa_arctica.AAC.1
MSGLCSQETSAQIASTSHSLDPRDRHLLPIPSAGPGGSLTDCSRNLTEGESSSHTASCVSQGFSAP